MSDVATSKAALAEIRRRDGKIQRARLRLCARGAGVRADPSPARRHLSGVELAWACRDFALEQFGMLASSEY